MFDIELKNSMQNLTPSKNPLYDDGMMADIKSHLLVDDHAIGHMNKNMQVKLGGLLTNLMCKTLKYKIGKKEMLLLKQLETISNINYLY